MFGIRHLRECSEMVQQAFDTKMKLTIYWNFFINSLVNWVALHFKHSFTGLVEYALENVMVDQILVPIWASCIASKRQAEEER